MPPPIVIDQIIHLCKYEVDSGKKQIFLHLTANPG
jgi:hypothetical protein